MEKHKRYLAFKIYDYSPLGGLGDISETFDTIPEAIDHLKELSNCDRRVLYDRLEGVEIDLELYGIKN